MNKKLLLVILSLVIALFIIGYLILNPEKQKISPFVSQQKAKVTQPSETSIEYTDPSGFTFSYPDNLSIVKNDIADESTYADIQLNSKDVNGSLNLKITDSKFATIDDWLKLNKDAATEPPKEVKLGNLKAMEIKTSDRLLLGALDKGILFNIEMPLIENNFWMKVYNKILTGFSFVSPETANAAAPATSDVSFEGEEVIE